MSRRSSSLPSARESRSLDQNYHPTARPTRTSSIGPASRRAPQRVQSLTSATRRILRSSIKSREELATLHNKTAMDENSFSDQSNEESQEDMNESFYNVLDVDSSPVSVAKHPRELDQLISSYYLGKVINIQQCTQRELKAQGSAIKSLATN